MSWIVIGYDVRVLGNSRGGLLCTNEPPSTVFISASDPDAGGVGRRLPPIGLRERGRTPIGQC